MDDQEKLRFIGPPLRWCNAMVPGTGVMIGYAVRCNRVMSEGQHCTAEADHIRPEHAGECPGFQLARQDLICGTCGHPLEQHSNAEDLGDTQAAPVLRTRAKVVKCACGDVLGHVGPCTTCGATRVGLIPWGAACRAPLNADGTCPDADQHV